MEHLHSIFAIMLCIFSLGMCFSLTPVEAVIYLILTFLCTGIILFLFNCEFLGVSFVIVYVGAIAILFLFVIMMLPIKNSGDENIFISSAIVSKMNIIFMIFLIIFFIYYFPLFLDDYWFDSAQYNTNVIKFIEDLSTLDILAQALYNYYFIYVLLAGYILLIALIGAVVITFYV